MLAMFCWETLGPTIHVDDTLTRTYLSIVAGYVHPFMGPVFLEGCGLLFQEWFDKFEVLTCSPVSPDLSPIEHLWDALGKKSLIHGNLRKLCLKSWCQILQHTFSSLVESIPRQVRAVVVANGGPGGHTIVPNHKHLVRISCQQHL